MVDIVGRKWWCFGFSAFIVIPGLIFILLTPVTNGAAGLKFSIDYTGGTLWDVHFRDQNPSAQDVKGVLDAQGLSDSTVTTSSDGYVLIRTEPIGLESAAPVETPPPVASVGPSTSPAASGSAAPSGSPAASASPAPSPSPSPSAAASAAASGSPAPGSSAGAGVVPSPSPSAGLSIPTTGRLYDLAVAMQAKFGPIDGIREQTTIGPVISSELTTQAILLVILGSIGILLWVSFRFRDLKFGTSAIIALVHDVIVVVGTFAILGTLFGVQIDALFVTAMLTIIGFSVHDTIVVFDRIRENRQRHAGEPFAAIVNHSIMQTIGRSINTSMTVLITLLALLLFGAGSIQGFIIALLIGILTGTYSSVFNASPMLVLWYEWEERRRLNRPTARPAR